MEVGANYTRQMEEIKPDSIVFSACVVLSKLVHDFIALPFASTVPVWCCASETSKPMDKINLGNPTRSKWLKDIFPRP